MRVWQAACWPVTYIPGSTQSGWLQGSITRAVECMTSVWKPWPESSLLPQAGNISRRLNHRHCFNIFNEVIDFMLALSSTEPCLN